MTTSLNQPAEIRRDSVKFGFEKLGWSFTPLNGKRPSLNEWQKRPRESISQAIAWAESGNIGIRTGRPSGGLVIIDIDPGGDISPFNLPATVSARSGGGGVHLYFRSDQSFKNTVAKLAANIDTRAEGGQVVYPGSIHPDSGNPYEWIEGREPWNIALAELPQSIIDRLSVPKSNSPIVSDAKRANRPDARQLRYVNLAIRLECKAVAGAVEGTRNQTLNNAALSLGRLVGGGYVSRSEIELALIDAAQSAGLPDFESRATIKSGLDAGERQPRNVATEISERRKPGRPTRRNTDNSRPIANADDARTQILIDTVEYRVIEDTIKALTADPGVFQRGNILVRSVRDEQPTDGILRADGSATISAIPVANLRERLTRYAAFQRVDDSGECVPCHPSAWLVSAIHARGEWPGVRPLLGVSDAPILRPDGSIWQTPGYDDRTGVVFEPAKAATFRDVNPEVNADDADAALNRLLDVVCDFKFEAQEHRAAWLAGLLTPLARFAYSGPSPLFLIDANIRGAGKGLLAQTIGQIVLGREMPVSSYSADAVEMRKRITACAIAGDRTILLDNLEGVFGNDAIDRALTSTLWKDRILGKSEEVELPLIAAWYATGNNVAVAADTARRLLHIRLDVLEERPENRSGFRHTNLVQWIREHRPALLIDALTILSAYIRAGKPVNPVTPFGSFEGWSSLVRQAVVWAGMPDPCLTRAKLAESSDTTADSVSQLLEAWSGYDSIGCGLTVSELMSRLYPMDRTYTPNDESSVAMRAAIESLIGCPPGRTPTIKQVGYKLRAFKRRVVGSRFLDIDDAANDKRGARWKLYSLN